jgi:hypothetical protein
MNLEENKEIKDHILKRSLFGTDFSVNLFKVKSYSEYYSIFEKSPFSDEEIDLFVSENPKTFLDIEL